MDSIRLDKWLWAARFFKTRPLATEAVNGGRVHLNGHRVKPGRVVQIGDELRIQRGPMTYEVIVKGINKQRRPASEMDQLYEETPASIEARQQLAELRKMAAGTRAAPARRPNKHERKHIVRFKRKQ
ncbi:MAG: RNA-binding protein [Thiotrichales bacterium]|nr:MAG: RNA-binding protein [Thiotrichales bacterium]